MNKKIAVLAGNYDQFNQFLEENGGTDSEYLYVWGDVRLAGVRLKDYIIYGTFWESKDANELLELTKSKII